MIGKGHHQARRGRLRRWPRRILIVANVAVFVVIASSATVVGYAAFEFGQIHRVHATLAKPQPFVIIGGKKYKVPKPSEPPFTVLFVGSDSRAGAVHSGVGVGSTATNSENLSDSIILARVAPATHQVALLSIPRDLWVSIPGIGMGKINAAFSGGDPSRLIAVIENDLGIPVNHFAEVTFDAFEQIADAIGGVEQYFPTPAFDTYSELRINNTGCAELQGGQALAFVRSRHYMYVEPGQEAQEQAEPESDLGRIQRQQAFIKNAINKIRRGGDLTDPVTLEKLVSSITKNLTVDQTFSDRSLISLAEDFKNLNANNIPNTTYPVVNYTVDGTSALTGIPEADEATVAQFEKVGTDAPTTHKKAAAKKATPRPTTSSTLPHAGISVEVENGSGVSNQAAVATTALTGAGFVVSSSTDADNFAYTRNVVEHGPGGAAAAQTLQGVLAGGATLTSDPSLGGDDLVLITGSAWSGLGSSTSSGPTTTTTLAVPSSANTVYGSSSVIEPGSSSYYHGVYIPPGRVQGQAVQTCGN